MVRIGTGFSLVACFEECNLPLQFKITVCVRVSDLCVQIMVGAARYGCSSDMLENLNMETLNLWISWFVVEWWWAEAI